MSESGTFSFVITFARGQGDPRRVFDAASLLIDGFQGLDATIAQSVDSHLRAAIVLENISSGSLRVVLTTLLQDIDDQALKDGDWKKAIGPLLVTGKRMAIEVLNKSRNEAPKAVEDLTKVLEQEIANADIKHIPAYAPSIRAGSFLA